MAIKQLMISEAGPALRYVCDCGFWDAKQPIYDLYCNPGDEMYYPNGVTDPDYCVLKFTAQNRRYYSKFKSENFEVE
jgi:hypothetical protein